MFLKIESQMAVVGITKKKLAEIIGIKYNTLLKKFNCTSSFTFDEAVKIRTAINSTESIEILFDKQTVTNI